MTASSAMLAKLKSLPGAGTTGSWPSTDPFAGAAVNRCSFGCKWPNDGKKPGQTRWESAESVAADAACARTFGKAFLHVCRPILTGSVPTTKTIGTVWVTSFSASAEGVVDAAITAGLRRTRSVAMQAADRRNFRPIGGAIHVYGGDFFGAERSEWDPETLEEGRYDAAKTMRLFEEANALYRTA